MHDIHKIASIKQVSYRHSSSIGFIRAISGPKLAQFFVLINQDWCVAPGT